jgi:D-alanine-D-alanine ligase
MRIAIVHNAVHAGEGPDAGDVLVQVETVAAALAELGHDAVRVPCTLDLAAAKALLENPRPDLAFNLVESLDGTGRLIHLIPGLMDAMSLPYTGSCAEAILVTSHKVLAKDRLVACRLPTPPWIGPFPEDIPALGSGLPGDENGAGGRWLVKSLWEHASIGIDETDALLCDRTDRIMDVLREHAPRFGGACFAERFIEGREFNLSLLAGTDRSEILKPAEIVFEGYPEEALRIVGYRAKWDAGSYEYHHTPRRFDFPPSDAPLLQRLQELAHQCWQAFGLKGYARIDFRVDASGQPWILEINANPCLSPDAGFAAALQQSGVAFTTAIDRILADTLRSGR